MSNNLKKVEQEIFFYINFILTGGQAKTILFYPEYPHKRTIMYKILKQLKYNITSNPKHKFDLAFYWEDITFRGEVNVFNKVPSYRVMNINCVDISKKKITEVFEKVFRYGLNVDPLTYSGLCVKKSNLNAQHDGVTVQCPIVNPEEGFVYQLVLNNIVDDKLVMDIRTPVLKGKIPFIYLKYKTIKDRFTNDVCKSEVASVNEYLTRDETEKVTEFCLQLGLDYGELDILRNKENGKIYIVDVNYTPWGPPAKLSNDETRKAIVRMGETFKNIYFG